MKKLLVFLLTIGTINCGETSVTPSPMRITINYVCLPSVPPLLPTCEEKKK